MNDNWILLKNEKPTVKKHGKKVLIARLCNPEQIDQELSIHDTNMVKHCDPDETYWTTLPKSPFNK